MSTYIGSSNRLILIFFFQHNSHYFTTLIYYIQTKSQYSYQPGTIAEPRVGGKLCTGLKPCTAGPWVDWGADPE